MSPAALRRLAAAVVASALFAQGASDTANLPPARGLLDDSLRALPDIPIAVRGELAARTPSGKVEKKLNVEMLMDWKARPPSARYTLRDGFGKALDHLALTWPEGGPVDYRYFRGEPLVAAPLPRLADAVHDTDLSWMDLSLAFLWWTNVQTVGELDLRGRPCFLVDATAPPGEYPGLGGVRVWLDRDLHVVLRAELFDATNAPVRRMDVKGFKKINNRWFIKDIEVVSLPSRHKTVLTVKEVEDRQRKQFIRLDEGGEESATPDAPPPDPVPAVTPVPP